MVSRRPDDEPRISYRNRIAVLPGDPPIAYRPKRVIVDDQTLADLRDSGPIDFTDRDVVVEAVFTPPDDVGDAGGEYAGDMAGDADGANAPDDSGNDDDGDVDDSGDGDAGGDVPLPMGGQWHLISGVADAPDVVEAILRGGGMAQLDLVYFANSCDCCGCPPHPALAGEYAADPWRANPWRANPWRANPWRANAEELNVLASGKPPTSSVMPAPERSLPVRPGLPQGVASNGVRVGVLDSGLAGGWHDQSGLRPELLGKSNADLKRISGPRDLPSRPIGGQPADNYLDPVAGHGTFIAGIIEQLTPGCKIRVERVFEPEGDVGTFELAGWLWWLMFTAKPQIVNFSFGGTGRDVLFEFLIDFYHDVDDVVFVAAAGNEGSCVPQYPAAMDSVIGVAGLGPTGPAEWSNYGSWVDACAPGTDLVSSFFAKFDGALPRINGIDTDDFTEWATWTGTSFAAPVVVAALAREMVSTNCTAAVAVERVIEAPHLARLVDMGTIVNY